MKISTAISNANAAHTSISPCNGKFNPKQKLRDAIKSARQRCNNTNNKDYPNYGGKGIKCLVSAADVEAAIGLPKNKSLSLDRIDPHGHYMVGNLRWTNKHVQAANKKAANPTTSLHATLEQFKDVAEAKNFRAQIAELWKRGIRGHNLRANPKIAPGCMLIKGDPFEASFEFSDHKDFGMPPGEFFLPSLTAPGERIVVRGGAWMPDISNGEATECGIIWGLGSVDPALNVSSVELHAYSEVLKGQGAGIIWHGKGSFTSPLENSVERRMLAAASNFFVCKGKSAAMFPLTHILKLMEEEGSTWASELEYHPLLKARYLFVPDLQIDTNLGSTLGASEGYQLTRLLKLRMEAGGKSFLGIQRHMKLPPSLREFVFASGKFTHLESRVCTLPKAMVTQ